jgi:streptogramin lyase
MNTNLLSICVLLSAHFGVVAQPLPHFRTVWGSGASFSQGSLRSYDAVGNFLGAQTLPVNAAQSVVLHPTGLVLVGTNASVLAFGPTGGVAFQLPVPSLRHLAVLPSGDILTLQATFLTSPVLTRWNQGGIALWSRPIPFPSAAAQPLPIRVDPSGTTWVAASTGTIHGVDGSGLLLPILVSPATYIRDFHADSQGSLWILDQSGGAFALFRMTASLQVATTFPLSANVIRMTLDAMDRPVLLVQSGSTASRSVQTLQPANGTVLSSATLASASSYEDFAVDGNGVIWATAQNTNRLDIFDDFGNLLSGYQGTVPALGPSAGDLTGVRLATTLAPLGDLDLDAAPNREEIRLGADPFDGAITPPTIQALGTLAPASILTLECNFPGAAGTTFLLGASLSSGEILLPGRRLRAVPLAVDPFFLFWFSGANNLLSPVGTLDAQGLAAKALALPNFPLGNVELHLAMVTLEAGSSSVGTLSRRLTLTIP